MAQSNLKQFVSNLSSASKGQQYAFAKTNEFEVELFFNSNISESFWEITKSFNHNGILPGLINGIDQGSMISDINYYVNEVKLANLEQSGKVINIGSKFKDGINPGINENILDNGTVVPQNNYELDLVFLDTEKSFVDSIIYPWMYFNASPVATVPSNDTFIKSHSQILTANINVNMYTNIDGIKTIYRTYVFNKCLPIAASTPDFTHENAKFILRDVKFAFSGMSISNFSRYDASEAIKTIDSKINSLGSTIPSNEQLNVLGLENPTLTNNIPEVKIDFDVSSINHTSNNGNPLAIDFSGMNPFM